MVFPIAETTTTTPFPAFESCATDCCDALDFLRRLKAEPAVFLHDDRLHRDNIEEKLGVVKIGYSFAEVARDSARHNLSECESDGS